MGLLLAWRRPGCAPVLRCETDGPVRGAPWGRQGAQLGGGNLIILTKFLGPILEPFGDQFGFKIVFENDKAATLTSAAIFIDFQCF